MIDSIKEALGAIVGAATNLRRAAGPGRAFELYVMTGIACALKACGFEVWIQRSDGSRVKPSDNDRHFVQRGGAPMGIPSSSAQVSKNASSIAFHRPGGLTWELHNGVLFRGRSAALHEIDIALMPQEVAKVLRTSGGGCPLGRPRLSIECKDVGTNGNVDEMRAFVARMYDLTLLRAHQAHLPVCASRTIHPGDDPPESFLRPVLSYRQENLRTFNVLARRTGFAKGATSLSGYYGVCPHGGITVQSPSATELMADVAHWIRQRGY